MHLILVNRRLGKSHHMSAWVTRSLIVLALLGMVGLFSLGRWSAQRNQSQFITHEMVSTWVNTLEYQNTAVESLQELTRGQVDALTVRLAELQARLTRLDALGERLTSAAGMADGEFDFSTGPAVGGPNELLTASYSYSAPILEDAIEQLAAQIEDRESQLRVLESLLDTEKIQKETFIAGRPIERGWMSSRYGYRNDPFTGQIAWHNGLDFAGKEDSNVISVAAGVVTYAAERYGYGLLVEINHGSGYVTRYGHNKEILVSVGDVVEKNQVLSKMGSTGRSTGPHVHFEVFKDGKSVDPGDYIHR